MHIRRSALAPLVVVLVLSPVTPVVAEDNDGSYFSRESAVAPDGTFYVATQARPGATLQGAVWAFHPAPTCANGDSCPMRTCADQSECTPLKWRFNISSASSIINSHPVVGADRTVYIGADDGFFYALDPDAAGVTYSYLWRFKTDPVANIWGGAAIDEVRGRIYVGSMAGDLYAFSIDSNRRGSFDGHIDKCQNEVGHSAATPCLWKLPMPCDNGPCDNALWFTPVIAQNGVVYVGTESNGLVAVLPSDLGPGLSCPGSPWSLAPPCVLWQFKSHGPTSDPRGFRLGGAIDSAQTLYVNDDVHTSSTGGTVYALAPTPSGGNPSTCVLGPDGQSVATQDRRCIRWSKTFKSMLMRNRPVLSRDGLTIYVASRSTFTPPSGFLSGLNALRTSDGCSLWSFRPPQEFSYSFAALHPGRGPLDQLRDAVFIGDTNGVLYALSGEDLGAPPGCSGNGVGDELWEANLLQQEIRSTPIISRDGQQVFIGGRSKVLVALDVDCGCERWQYDTSDDSWQYGPSCQCCSDGSTCSGTSGPCGVRGDRSGDPGGVIDLACRGTPMWNGTQVASECECVNPNGPACGGSNPTCDGACPIGSACLSYGSSSCYCLPLAGVPCGSVGAPLCWGTCPPEAPVCKDCSGSPPPPGCVASGASCQCTVQ